jgi:hypothetical protein
MPTHSQLLRRKLEFLQQPLGEAAGAIWNHPRLSELFPDFLFAVHGVIRATELSMRTAADCARARAATDPVAAGIADYLARHSAEEAEHDDWLLDDIESLGIPRDKVLRQIPLPVIAQLVGSQYYWAHHYHPVAFLGYIAVLEGPPSVEFLESVVARTALPRQAFGTQFLHARLDPHHIREFEELLDSLPLEPEHVSVIGVSALTSADLLRQVYKEVVERFEAQRHTEPRGV